MIEAGQMRHRITIQRSVRVRDTGGGSTTTWQDVATVWAKVEPLSGTEYWTGQGLQSRISHRITMRYRTGIRASQRIVYGSRTFEISSVINEDERDVQLTLMCEELRANTSD